MAKKEPPTTGTNSDFASTFGEIRVEMLFVLSCIVDIEKGVWERERGRGGGKERGRGICAAEMAVFVRGRDQKYTFILACSDTRSTFGTERVKSSDFRATKQ